eukprot:augustus_masked-scaffold_13-processed-gene-10.8-mRNA-1 protein AED:0.09 eAED:0.86 QI:0/-1/0/1/-1/1/1/0/328
MTIKALKEQIATLTNIEPNRQRLIHFGKMMNNDSRKIDDYKVNSGDFIHLVPLPKNFNPETSVQVNQSNASNLPAHSPTGPNIFQPFAGPNSPDPFILNMDAINNLPSNADYFERVELGFCRARLRLLSSTMLFYYILTAFSALGDWTHPEYRDSTYESGHGPSDLYLLLNVFECLMGIAVAMRGVRAAASDHLLCSSKFFQALVQLFTLHLISFIIYSKEFISGDIVYSQTDATHMGHEGSETSDEAAQSLGPVQITVFNFFISMCIWFWIFSIAVKFHRQLAIVHPQDDMEPLSSIIFTNSVHPEEADAANVPRTESTQESNVNRV